MPLYINKIFRFSLLLLLSYNGEAIARYSASSDSGVLRSGQPEMGAAHSAAVQLGAGESHHDPHPDSPLHGARLALPLRLPGPRQRRPPPQGRPAAGETLSYHLAIAVIG